MIPLLLAASVCLAPTLQQVAPTSQALGVRLSSPTRIAALPSGLIAVTDSRTREVVLLKPPQLAFVRRFSVDGSPLAIGSLGDQILVGDAATRQVKIFDAYGAPAGVLGGVQVENPTDLATDEAAQRVFVLDAGAKHVKVFDTSVPGGQLVQTIGAPGSTFTVFQNPTGIAIDPLAQEVYVSDFGELSGSPGARVLIYGYDGTYKDRIWGDGGPTGQYFARPQGLALGTQPGHVFVVDSWRGEVVVMDRFSGTQVGVLGKYGKQKGELQLPLDAVIFGPNHDLIVTSNRTRRIETYDQGGAL